MNITQNAFKQLYILTPSKSKYNTHYILDSDNALFTNIMPIIMNIRYHTILFSTDMIIIQQT